MSFHRANLLPIALSAFLLAPGLAFAQPKPKPKPATDQAKHVELLNDVQVDGKTLPAGKYDIDLENGTANFQQHGQNVLSAPGEWKTLAAPAPYSGAITDNNTLKEFEFAGSDQALQID
jgi:hypothetical protein